MFRSAISSAIDCTGALDLDQIHEVCQRQRWQSSPMKAQQHYEETNPLYSALPVVVLMSESLKSGLKMALPTGCGQMHWQNFHRRSRHSVLPLSHSSGKEWVMMLLSSAELDDVTTSIQAGCFCLICSHQRCSPVVLVYWTWSQEIVWQDGWYQACNSFIEHSVLVRCKCLLWTSSSWSFRFCSICPVQLVFLDL